MLQRARTIIALKSKLGEEQTKAYNGKRPYDEASLRSELFVLDAVENLPPDSAVIAQVRLQSDESLRNEMATIIELMVECPTKEFTEGDMLVLLDILEDDSMDIKEYLDDSWFDYSIA